MRKEISLEKIARRAGVAKSTVSFVINNKGNVSPHTKEKVLSALQELGYAKETEPLRPNLPVNLHKESKNVLIYVNPTVRENEVAVTYMAGLRDYSAQEGNLTFSFAMSSSEAESIMQFQFLEQATQPQAFLIIGINSSHVFVQQVLKGGKPCLLLNRLTDNPDLSYVSINHHAAGQEAASYLQSLGHRHFAVVLEDYYNETELLRLEGFLERLAENSSEVQIGLVRRYKAPEISSNYQATRLQTLLTDDQLLFNNETALTIPPGLTVWRNLEQLDPNFAPTCLLAANDRTAFATQNGLQTAGLRVPQDVSVMSLNSSSLSLSASPQITALDELWHEQGYLAGRVLEELIERKTVRCQKIQIKHRLIERGSTGRPPLD